MKYCQLLDSKISKLIVSAGMRRSGSTWLYNALRLLLVNSSVTGSIISFGWIYDLPHIQKKEILLIKTHDFDNSLINLEIPKIILYSFRDIRDALASAKRKWGTEPSIELADSYIRNDLQWRKYAAFIMRYESMIGNPISMLTELASVIDIRDFETDRIMEQLNELSYNSPGEKNIIYHRENLLHKGHITNGRHGSWEGYLNDKLLEQIENKYRDWLIQNHYQASH